MNKEVARVPEALLGAGLPQSAANIKRTGRIYLLDELRGFAVICMVFHHMFYSMYAFLGWSTGRTLFEKFEPVQPVFWFIFFGISGICSQLSSNNLTRGAKLCAVAAGITLVTYFVVPNELIIFGVIHFLALCMVIFHFAKPLLARIEPRLGMALSLVCYILTRGIDNGYLGLIGFFTLKIPSRLYDYNFLYIFGIVNKNFSSADYFPLLPYMFLFFAGAFLGVYAKNGGFYAFTYKSRAKPLQWVGTHALIIYIVHQPVFFGLFSLINFLSNK